GQGGKGGRHAAPERLDGSPRYEPYGYDEAVTFRSCGGPLHRHGRLPQAGTPVRLLPNVAPPGIGLYAVYPPSRRRSAKVRGFVDSLVARFGGEPECDHADGSS